MQYKSINDEYIKYKSFFIEIFDMLDFLIFMMSYIVVTRLLKACFKSIDDGKPLKTNKILHSKYSWYPVIYKNVTQLSRYIHRIRAPHAEHPNTSSILLCNWEENALHTINLRQRYWRQLLLMFCNPSCSK